MLLQTTRQSNLHSTFSKIAMEFLVGKSKGIRSSMHECITVRTHRGNSVFQDKKPISKKIETSISDEESESSVEIVPHRNLRKTNDKLIFEVMEGGDKDKIVR